MNGKKNKLLDILAMIALTAPAFLSVVIGILEFLGVIDNIPWLAGKVPAFTLIATGSIASYLIFERKIQLEKMNDNVSTRIENLEKVINESTITTIASLQGVELTPFASASDLMRYVTQRLKQAQNRIDDLSWSPIDGLESNLNNSQKAYTEYEEHITKTSEKIAYREVMVFNHPARIENLQRRIAENAPGYSCSYYEPPNVPVLQFMIIDKSEVIVLSDQFQTKFALRNPHIVKLFEEYYEEIWKNAMPIKIKTEIKANVVNTILKKDWGFALRK